MFQHILVPLDGSPRAEQALPVAARIARATKATITLFHAVMGENEYGLYPTRAMLETALANANGYLEQVAQSKTLAGIRTRTEVLSGKAAQAILEYSRPDQIDLIILCSHGYTGFKRWMLGSVSQKVGRHSSAPVLILREEVGLQPEETCPIRVMVALDGSSLAETALIFAAYLSAALSAPMNGALHLVRVLPLPVMYEYGQDDNIARARRQGTQEAMTYLSAIEQRLQEGDVAKLKLQVTSLVAVHKDVAATLIKVAEVGAEGNVQEGHNKCDVIALTTHGRSGLQQWTMGSVAESILGATRLPLFIVHAPKPEKKRGELKDAIDVPLQPRDHTRVG